jgi:CO/xanthine dehydrogenase FAD-binding subunit
MASLDFVQATSLADAVTLLNAPGLRCCPIAGGTDLVVAMRQRGTWFDRLVDVTAVPELVEIAETPDQLRIGAAVTFARAAADPRLCTAVPMLVEACLAVGSPQIRNTGTLGGNVINAAACADSLPPLVALDAQAHIVGPHGERIVSIAELVTGPHRTTLQAGALLTHFTFQKLPLGARSTFIKLGRRNAQAISRLSLAAAGRMDSAAAIDYIRLTPGAALPHTRRLTQVEDLLKGQRPTRALFAEAGKVAAHVVLDSTGRRWSTEYKEIAIQGLVEQALLCVFGASIHV